MSCPKCPLMWTLAAEHPLWSERVHGSCRLLSQGRFAEWSTRAPTASVREVGTLSRIYGCITERVLQTNSRGSRKFSDKTWLAHESPWRSLVKEGGVNFTRHHHADDSLSNYEHYALFYFHYKTIRTFQDLSQIHATHQWLLSTIYWVEQRVRRVEGKHELYGRSRGSTTSIHNRDDSFPWF